MGSAYARSAFIAMLKSTFYRPRVNCAKVDRAAAIPTVSQYTVLI